MNYPSRGEYDTAVRKLDQFVLDSVLNVGKPVMQPKNPNLLRAYCGGKAIVYEIQTNTKKYVTVITVTYTEVYLKNCQNK